MKNAIESHQVSFQYFHTESPFLKNIDLEVKEGECLLICGASGSGKSTFSRLLNGISPNYIEGDLSGELYTFNLKAGEADIEEYVSLVGSVFQNPKTQHFTVDTTSELAFPLENQGIASEEIKEKVYKNGEMFDVAHLLNRNIFNLSGGEKQQIAFVSANMLKPQLLILDEVTSNLDKEAIHRIREMIVELKAQGITIVILEHRLAWTKGIVDRYIMFEEGRIVDEWSAETFNEMSNTELNRLGLRSMDLSSHQDKIREKTAQQNQSQEGALKTEQLAIGYTNHPVLSDLNLQFEPGKIVGLLGANGTGKSTLANTLTGLQKPLSGSISWEGKQVTEAERVDKSYLVMQDMNYQLFTESVLNEILLGAKYPEYAESVLEALNLQDYKESHPMTLSEGQKQRVAIASALLSGKELIVFDEPTSGLDYNHMERFGHLLNKLKDTDTVIIVITHDEELASKWCDTIIDLNEYIEEKG